MRINEIREMSTKELLKRIDEETENLDNLKFQHATTRIQNTSVLKKNRHLIAKMKTIVKERELNPSLEPAGEAIKKEENS